MKRLVFLLLMIIFALSGATLSSCSRKSGCPVYESTKAPVNRKGELSTRGGNSSLFPKSMTKKMKKG